MEFPIRHDNAETGGRSRSRMHGCAQAPSRNALHLFGTGRGMHIFQLLSVRSLKVYGKLANRAGIPPGVINVVTTDANISDVGREMCENPTVRKVSFTGSTNVAKLLYKYAAGTMKKYALNSSLDNCPLICLVECLSKLEAMLRSLCLTTQTSTQPSKVRVRYDHSL